MKIKSVGIAGLGLIGGSLAKAIKAENNGVVISGFDFSEVIEKAVKQKIIDQPLYSSDDLLQCDLIILALPIYSSINLFNELYPQLGVNQTLIDVCSVKYAFTSLSKKIMSKGKYVGLHPMAGKEKGGLENSDHLLFENAICFVCDEEKNHTTESVLGFLKCTGSRFIFIDAELHDRITAEVSHLPQLISVALVNSVTKIENGFNFINFAGSGFRDMTRIASSDFSLWKEILIANKTNIINSLNDFMRKINELKDALQKEDLKYLQNQFESANKSRNEIPLNNKGFIQPLFDITVFLEDKAGTLNRLTSILASHNLNIKNIELLKIREGSGGNFRLYFDSAETAQKAHLILKENNFATNYTN